jgi:cobalt-zinc-cadmium efflux system membrane fusion protein
MIRRHRFAFVLWSFVGALAGCGERGDHDHDHDDGHAHGHEADHGHGAEELEPTSATVFGERVLLFLEHPHLVRGVPARFLAHYSVLATGEPVRSGAVTLEIGSTTFAADAPRRDGLFVPEGSLPSAGTFPARIVLRGEQAEETLDLGEVVVHASEADAAAAAASGAEEPQDAVPFLLEQQWKIGLMLERASPRTLTERRIVPARVAPLEGNAAAVAAPVAGRLLPPDSGTLPRTGDVVEKGRVLAYVEPPLGAPELAQLRALRIELDLAVLEVAGALGEARSRLRFAEREHERIAKLRAEGLSTAQQFEEAERDLAVGRTELEAAAGRNEALERLASESPGSAAEPRFPLVAPIAGRLVEVRAAQGESVGPEAPVFRILDATRLAIEGRASELDLALLDPGRLDPGVPAGAGSAVARFAAFPERAFELRGLRDGRPHVGAEVDPSTRTFAVRYELDNADGSIRPGMLADLEIATGARNARVAIPREAVVMDQGLPTAYVMLEGELFQRRDLQLGAKDGAWVEVVRGIAAGERVATRGAYVVRLAALSPASFGHGHAH